MFRFVYAFRVQLSQPHVGKASALLLNSLILVAAWKIAVDCQYQFQSCHDYVTLSNLRQIDVVCAAGATDKATVHLHRW